MEDKTALQRGATVIVGTPQRILSTMESGTFNPSNLSFLVLEETDDLWDMGFEGMIEDIARNKLSLS